MKKVIASIVLGLLWCNVGFADILLKNCKAFEPAGTKRTDGSIRTKEEIIKLRRDRWEYFVSYEDGIIYQTVVKSKSQVAAFREMGMQIKRTANTKYIITFADDKLITAEGKQGQRGDDDPYYTIGELELNLENGEIRVESYGETYEGKELVQISKDMTGDAINYTRCDDIKSSKDATGESSGTAFFISKKGYLLTNNHVVEGCKVSKINYFNKEYDTELIATDKTLDLALLKSEVRPKSFITFSKDEPKKRQTITAAGYPLGKFLSDDLKINDGRISALKGFENNSNEIQHDIAINPGNSGGPIVNEKGQLVAIAVSGMAKDVTEGLNFGIKASAAANFLKSNKISPSTGYMSFSTSGDKLVKLLEESTVYTFCN